MQDVTVIGNCAFKNAGALYRVNASENSMVDLTNVITIGESAFENAISLLSLKFHAVTSIGKYAFSGCESLKSADFGISEATVRIDDHAFEGCIALESVTGMRANYIGEHAFENCLSLKAVESGNDDITYIRDYAFSGCKSLQRFNSETPGELFIGSNMKAIGAYAFEYCREFMNVIISDSVTGIGEGAFKGCGSIREMTVPFIGRSENPNDSNACILGFWFERTMVDKEHLTSEGQGYTTQTTYFYNINNQGCYAYYIPESLRKVTITKQSKIPDNAFKNCDLIEEIFCWQIVTAIGNNTFKNCSSLKRINASEYGEVCLADLITIGEYAFANCKKINSFNSDNYGRIIIPDSVTSIGAGAFEGSVGWEEITLPFVGKKAETSNSDESSFGYIFGYAGQNGDFLTTDRSGSTSQVAYWYSSQNNGYRSYYIPESIRKVTVTKQTRIPAYAFRNCDMLKSVAFLSEVTRVGSSAFENCRFLEASFDGDIEYIGERAFGNMQKLRWFVFSDNLKTLGANVFDGCINLTDVYFSGTDEQWEAVEKSSTWDNNTYFYFHRNINRYGLYLGLNALHWVETDDYYALIPCNAISNIRLIDTKTNEVVPFNETQISFDAPNGKVSLSELSFSGIQGGFTILNFSGAVDGNIGLQEKIYLLVIERSTENISLHFDRSELNYITLSFNMTLAMHNIANPEDIVKEDLSPSAMENILCGLANLSEGIGGLFRGDIPKTTHLKKVFGGFIQDYANSNYAHDQAVGDTQIILETITAIEEEYKRTGPHKLKDYFGFPSKAVKAVEEICNIVEKARDLGITIDEVERLGTLLENLTTFDEFEDWLRSSKRLADFMIKTNMGYHYYLSSLEHFRLFSLSNPDALIDLWGEKTIVIGKDVLNATDIGLATLDMVLYVACDYTNNIEIIEKMRSEMLASGMYGENDYEILVLDEMLTEYRAKWSTAIKKFATDLAGTTVVKLLEVYPVFSVFTIASELAMIVTDIDTKAELDVLNIYRNALYHCMGSVNSLFEDGKITTDIDELYFFSSLYLKMMLKSNELAREIVHDYIDDWNPENNETENSELTTYRQDLAILDDNINRINELLSKIQKLVVSS